MTDPPLPAPSDTLMHQEAAQTADIVADQYARNAATVKALADDLRRNPPPFVVTCARGSSDHAATYAKYLFETQLGVVTASASPSVGSVYEAKQRLADALYVVISQSGKSPDLLRNATQAKEAGARVVALVNVEDSPLALLADTVLPLRAGPERSVAATKSYLGSLAAILQLAAHWKNEAPLHAATDALPDALRRAWQADWSPLTDGLVGAHNLFVLGRGLGLAAAQEAALKFKETCGLHAEAYSSAEVLHGPAALEHLAGHRSGHAARPCCGRDPYRKDAGEQIAAGHIKSLHHGVGGVEQLDDASAFGQWPVEGEREVGGQTRHEAVVHRAGAHQGEHSHVGRCTRGDT